jgi:hypothetical protein
MSLTLQSVGLHTLEEEATGSIFAIRETTGSNENARGNGNR